VSLTDRWSVFLILVFSLIMAWSLFRTDLLAARDGGHSFVKVISLYQSIGQGNFLGRWIPDICLGYGYPMFLFYAPLFFYLSVGMTFLSGSFALGLHLALFLSLFLSGLTMYFFSKEYWGSGGGLLSAVAYLYVPYHVVDVFDRAACAEVLSFVFFPLILFFLKRIYERQRARDIALGALSVAGVCLSHNIMAAIFPPLALSYLIFLFAVDPERNWKKIASGVVALSWGGALALFFLLPALVEKKFVRLDRIVSGSYGVQNYFIDFSWIFSLPKRFVYAVIGGKGEVPLQIGPVHPLLAGITLWGILRRFRSERSRAQLFCFWILVIAVCVFFCLKISAGAWAILSLDTIMNFPVRFLVFVVLGFSFLAGGVIYFCPKVHRPVCFIACAVLLVCLNIGYCRPRGYDPVVIPDAEKFLFRSHPHENMESLPKWVQRIDFLPVVPSKLSVPSGKAEVLRFRRSSGGLEYSYEVKAATRAVLCFHSFYFPGWNVYLDGKRIPAGPTPQLGFVLFDIPEGFHEVKVRFERTSVRIVADAISGLALAAFPVLFFCLWVRSRRAGAGCLVAP